MKEKTIGALSTFTGVSIHTIKYYEKIGCPLGAIWQQDMNMQQAYYYKVLDFAKSKGVNMDVKSFLD